MMLRIARWSDLRGGVIGDCKTPSVTFEHRSSDRGHMWSSVDPSNFQREAKYSFYVGPFQPGTAWLLHVCQLNTHLGPTANPPTTRAVACLAKCTVTKECSDMHAFSFFHDELACVSVYLKFGAARTLPTPPAQHRLCDTDDTSHAGHRDWWRLWEVG